MSVPLPTPEGPHTTSSAFTPAACSASAAAASGAAAAASGARERLLPVMAAWTCASARCEGDLRLGQTADAGCRCTWFDSDALLQCYRHLPERRAPARDDGLDLRSQRRCRRWRVITVPALLAPACVCHMHRGPKQHGHEYCMEFVVMTARDDSLDLHGAGCMGHIWLRQTAYVGCRCR